MNQSLLTNACGLLATKNLKKENILLFLGMFVAVLLVVQGCSKDFNSAPSDLTSEKQEKNINACLVFYSPDEVLDFLDDGTLTKSIQPSVQPDQFISMCETADVDVLQMLDVEIPVNVEPGKLTYYDVLSYDRYVPNENLAKLLNVRGEIQVGDLIYRITEAGTFYYPPSRQEEVNAQIIELSVKTGVMVDEVTRKTNAKKIVKKFDGSIQLGISVNALNLPASYADWAKVVFRGTDNVPKFKIKQDEVLIAGRLDNNWVGMILKKK